MRDLSNLPAHWSREIENFFDTYEHLEGEGTDIDDWGGVKAAWRAIEGCQAPVHPGRLARSVQWQRASPKGA